MFSKKATKIDKIFTVNLTVTTYGQIDGEDFINFSDLLRKHFTISKFQKGINSLYVEIQYMKSFSKI